MKGMLDREFTPITSLSAPEAARLPNVALVMVLNKPLASVVPVTVPVVVKLSTTVMAAFDEDAQTKRVAMNRFIGLILICIELWRLSGDAEETRTVI